MPSLTGIGLGLRPCHYPYIESQKPALPWFEILSDNYLSQTGSSFFHLNKICENYPITLHGVGMSLGSTDALNYDYLKKLKSLIAITKPKLVSDHLCWTSFNGQYLHELLPLPYTEEAVTHISKRILEVQDFLGMQIMIENVSTYLQYTHSTMHEWEFLQAVTDSADCLILLDINNIYVSAFNTGFTPETYIEKLSTKRVAQFHLAGFADHGNYLLDTHGTSIHDPVWGLYKQALDKFGLKPTAIERDNDIPDFDLLLKEVQLAQKIWEDYAVTT